MIGRGAIAEQCGRRIDLFRFQPAQEPLRNPVLLDAVEAFVLAQGMVEADRAHGGADVGVQVDLAEQLRGGQGLALHLDERLRDVQVADVNFRQHVGQEPGAVHLDEGGAPLTLFQGVEHRFLDIVAVERIDLLGRQERRIVEQTLAVHLVQAMGCLQPGGEFTCLLTSTELDLDHVELAVFGILPWAHLDHFADGKFHDGEDNPLAHGEPLFRGIDLTLGQLLLDPGVLPAQVFADQRQRKRVQRDGPLAVQQQLVQKIYVIRGDLELVPPESCCLGWALQHAFLLL